MCWEDLNFALVDATIRITNYAVQAVPLFSPQSAAENTASSINMLSAIAMGSKVCCHEDVTPQFLAPSLLFKGIALCGQILKQTRVAIIDSASIPRCIIGELMATLVASGRA